jgi:hypothetical protein
MNLNFISNKNLNKMLWLVTPVLLIAGCAETPRGGSDAYSPALTEPSAPTSDRPESRVYAETSTSVDKYSPPPGADAADWAVAEEIRLMFTGDRTLGRTPMAAVVKKGVVTLRGGTSNHKDRERLRNEISTLPGVARVDDQLEPHNPVDVAPGAAKNY